jgi:dipeptidyl-peptidase-3
MNTSITENNIIVDQFADIKVLRFKIPGFEQLSFSKKMLVYCLSEAALWGRDILMDQHYKHNMLIVKTLEEIYQKQITQNSINSHLEQYLKRVWFSNGIHHHYSTDKMIPDFTTAQMKEWITDIDDHTWETKVGMKGSELAGFIAGILFSEADSKRVCLSGDDLLKASASNFYDGVSQKEAEDFYSSKNDGHSTSPGLNSTLVKCDGKISEEIWHEKGRYGNSIKHIIEWLDKASQWADNERQKHVIMLLAEYYRTGDLAVFDRYNIEWLAEHESDIDFINGFIEVYADPLGMKATWESLVQVVNGEATRTVELISQNAQWFEDRSPVDARFRKKQVTGISMKVIDAVMLGGDCYPASPLGINLPNADVLREQYGSKSITLNNIAKAHQEAAASSGIIDEFAYSKREVELHRTYGAVADELHTHLHECLGHGSGSMMPGIKTDRLKEYSSVIEEARADLYALYFMADPKMIELGLAKDEHTFITHYNSYLRNGLLIQLARIEPGRDIEQAHMRNRAMIGNWLLEMCKDNGWVKLLEESGNFFVAVTHHDQLRSLFGTQLAEVQRIKSTGDYDAARNLVETYGVKIDAKIHNNVRERYKSLGVAPFSGFVNPRMQPIFTNNTITDIAIDYCEGYPEQMMRYSMQYRTL